MDYLIEKAADHLVNSRYAIALSGAGISTESGIPDFRGPDGIWTKNPDAEREAYRSYHKFLRDPREYWETRLSQPSILGDLEKAVPNPGHYALAELEKINIVKCVITQNVDGLHEKAGSKSVIEYHGSISKFRCPSCGSRFGSEEYELAKLRNEGRLPPLCSKCNAPVKGDVVHFNEPIPSDIINQSLEETYKCDVMLICGTSAVVHPFASLPRIARQRELETRRKISTGFPSTGKANIVMIIEVNAEFTPLTKENISDFLIQGKTAEVLPKLVEHVKRLSR